MGHTIVWSMALESRMENWGPMGTVLSMALDCPMPSAVPPMQEYKAMGHTIGALDSCIGGTAEGMRISRAMGNTVPMGPHFSMRESRAMDHTIVWSMALDSRMEK